MSHAKHTAPLRVGVIGLGMGLSHIKAYQKCPGASVLAICDLNEALLKSTAFSMEIPETFTDPDKMIRSGMLDAVSIATPNALHHPLTLAALEAGLHVLCEKPMAMNAGQAREMVATADRCGRKLAIHYNHRMNPAVQWIARAAQAGELGEIYYARTIWHRRRGIPARASFLDKRHSGGGCLIDLGVHMLDQTLYIMGYPQLVSVTAATHTKFDKVDVPHLPMDVDDFATCYFRFANGATMSMEISWASHHDHPEQQLVQIYGTQGGARRLTESYSRTVAEIYSRDHGALTTRRMDEPPSDLVSVQEDFVQAILEDREPLCSGRHGLVGMEILDAIDQSSRTGREVMLS